MGAPRKYDPKLVEQEFVTSKVSIRSLATKHDVAFSSLAAFARRNDWKGKRVAYQSALSRRGYEVMAADIANEEGEIRKESVTILRATLRVYAQKLAAGQVPIGVRDAVEAVRQLALLLQEPEGVNDGPTIINGRGRDVTPDADFLRELAGAARRRLDPGGVLAGGPGPVPPGAKPN